MRREIRDFTSSTSQCLNDQMSWYSWHSSQSIIPSRCNHKSSIQSIIIDARLIGEISRHKTIASNQPLCRAHANVGHPDLLSITPSHYETRSTVCFNGPPEWRTDRIKSVWSLKLYGTINLFRLDLIDQVVNQFGAQFFLGEPIS